MELLTRAGRPQNGNVRCLARIAQPEVKRLGVLRDIPGACLQILDHAVHFDARPYGVAIRLRADQPYGERLPSACTVVPERFQDRKSTRLNSSHVSESRM